MAGASLENFPNAAGLAGIPFPRLWGSLRGFLGSDPRFCIFPRPIQALQPLPALESLIFPGAGIESQLQRVRNGSGNSPAGNGAGPGPAAISFSPALIPFGMGFAGPDFISLLPEASPRLQRRILLRFPWNSGSSERCRNVWRSCGITSAAQSPHFQGCLGLESRSRQLREFFWDPGRGKAPELFVCCSA